MSWASNQPRATSKNDVAHFFGVDGKPICGAIVRVELGPLREAAHLYAYCRRIEPRACACGACSVVPATRPVIVAPRVPRFIDGRPGFVARNRPFLALARRASHARRRGFVFPLGRVVAERRNAEREASHV